MTTLEFNSMVTREKTQLRSYAYQLTRDTEDANDLLQETMLKAFTYREKFADSTNLKGWLFTIMKNSFINNYRKTIMRNTVMENTDNPSFSDNFHPSVRNNAERNIAMKDIQKAIQQLPEDIKKAFTMNNDGFKYQEIADVLAVPIGTIKTRIFMARRILRKKLAAYENFVA